jgi:hypothetical protein
MKEWKKLFKTPKAIIGMIHVQALPGTPRYQGSISKIIAQVKREAIIYQDDCFPYYLGDDLGDRALIARRTGQGLHVDHADNGFGG